MLRRLGAEEMRPDFASRWDTAVAALPSARFADEWLTPGRIEGNVRLCGLGPEYVAPMLSMAEVVRGDDALLSLASFFHWRIFLDDEPDSHYVWPTLASVLGENSGRFYLLAALGYVREYLVRKRALGIDEETLSRQHYHIPIFAEKHRLATGRLGAYPEQLAWLHSYFPDRGIYRIGRLEFHLVPYSYPYRVYRRRGVGDLVALAEGGIVFGSDGFPCFTDAPRPADARTTCFEEAGGNVAGHPVTDGGRIASEPVALDLGDWECMLERGAPVLDTHIPSGGGMAPGLVRESLSKALLFFDGLFPGERAKAFVGTSWIFSPQLRECLPRESNILAFQELVHLLPASGKCNQDVLWFVFNRRGTDTSPSGLPRDTSMQREIGGWLGRGNLFHVGAMCLLRGEIPK